MDIKGKTYFEYMLIGNKIKLKKIANNDIIVCFTSSVPNALFNEDREFIRLSNYFHIMIFRELKDGSTRIQSFAHWDPWPRKGNKMLMKFQEDLFENRILKEPKRVYTSVWSYLDSKVPTI